MKWRIRTISMADANSHSPAPEEVPGHEGSRDVLHGLVHRAMIPSRMLLDQHRRDDPLGERQPTQRKGGVQDYQSDQSTIGPGHREDARVRPPPEKGRHETTSTQGSSSVKAGQLYTGCHLDERDTASPRRFCERGLRALATPGAVPGKPSGRPAPPRPSRGYPSTP